MKIALSGLSGVGTSSTARLVSQALNLPMSNFTFRDLAVERGVAWEDLQMEAAANPEIDFELDRRLIQFVQDNESCLVASDLACCLDSPRLYQRLGLDRGADYDLKVWLEAPLEVRARRMAIRENKPIEIVMAAEDQRDRDNRKRFLSLYGIDLLDHSQTDLVIDTKHHTIEEVVAIMIERAQPGLA